MASMSPETMVEAGTPFAGLCCIPYGMVGIGAKAYLLATADFCSVGVIVGDIMICIPTLPLLKAWVASPAFHAIELGSAILYLVTQSNQNCVACTASGVFICAVLLSADR